MDQKNSKYGHFSLRVDFITKISLSTDKPQINTIYNLQLPLTVFENVLDDKQLNSFRRQFAKHNFEIKKDSFQMTFEIKKRVY